MNGGNTPLVETAPHEFAANYNFNDYGLRPYFAIDQTLKSADSWAAESAFSHDGETWSATLHKRESSGLIHPGDTTPDGTPFKIEEVREYGLRVEPEDDPIGERSFYAHIRPRWDNQQAEKNDGQRVEVNTPDGFGDGFNIKVQGSNIEFGQYLNLIQQAARSLGIRWDYFNNPHASSNIQDAARYVRIDESVSGPIHARDGPLVGLAHVLENDREGYRKLVQNDDDNHGRNLPGFYHTTTLGPERVREVFPDHALPKEAKHYYSRESLSRDRNNPLRHPKLEAAYQVSRWDESHGVGPDDIAQLNHELEETIIAILADAGLDVRPGGGTYVEDAYFEATESERNREIISLNLTEIRQTQESVVVRQLADGLSPVEWESLETLVTDGGEVSPKQIAESGGFHQDSVYRALDRMDELLERHYGRVNLRSTHVAELVHEAVSEAKDRTRAAVEAGAKALDAAERSLDEQTQAFVAWAAKHDINVNENDNVTLDLGTIEADSIQEVRRKVREALREGHELWTDMNRDPATYRGGSYTARAEVPEHNLRSIDASTKITTISGQIWQSLRGR